MVEKYRQGAIVYMDFDSLEVCEQRGRRPALIVSNRVFNKISNLTMVCPITTTGRSHPLHIPLSEGLKTTGFIMCEQARMLDLKTRNAVYEEMVPDEIIYKAADLIISFIEII